MHSQVFTPDNSAMLLIDHQIGTMAWTHSHDINLVKQNALKLARIAKAANIPTILTSSMEDQIQGPLLPELKEILPEAFEARIKRPGIVNAMHHDGFNQAVKATGRKKLFVAGVTTEICVTFPVLQMLDEGYEVQVSADAPTPSMVTTSPCAAWRKPERSSPRSTRSSRSLPSTGQARSARSWSAS